MEITFDFFANETQAITDVADVDKEAPFINYAKIRYNRINYQNALRNILLPLDVKVLNFFPPKISIPDKIVSQTDQVWPVKPRKKPVIGPPEVVLDMPHFDSNISLGLTSFLNGFSYEVFQATTSLTGAVKIVWPQFLKTRFTCGTPNQNS
jgi:hypothetical protein